MLSTAAVRVMGTALPVASRVTSQQTREVSLFARPTEIAGATLDSRMTKVEETQREIQATQQRAEADRKPLTEAQLDLRDAKLTNGFKEAISELKDLIVSQQKETSKQIQELKSELKADIHQLSDRISSQDTKNETFKSNVYKLVGGTVLAAVGFNNRTQVIAGLNEAMKTS